MRSHKKAEPHCERCVLFTPLSVKNKFLALTPPEKCHCFTTSTIYTKGQEISERNFDVSNLQKKKRKKFPVKKGRYLNVFNVIISQCFFDLNTFWMIGEKLGKFLVAFLEN